VLGRLAATSPLLLVFEDYSGRIQRRWIYRLAGCGDQRTAPMLTSRCVPMSWVALYRVRPPVLIALSLLSGATLLLRRPFVPGPD
jgi:hypothetical protein